MKNSDKSELLESNDLDNDDELLPPPKNMKLAKQGSLSNIYNSYMSGCLRKQPSFRIKSSDNLKCYANFGSLKSNTSLLMIPRADQSKAFESQNAFKNSIEEMSNLGALM